MSDGRIEMCLHKIQIACDELLDNFPMKWLGKILYWVVFPLRKLLIVNPTIICTIKLSAGMLAPSDFRDRLTQYCYFSQRSDDPLYRLDTSSVANG